MVFRLKRAGILLACLLGAGCSTSGTSAPVHNVWNQVESTQTMHRVQPGETFSSVAWRYGLREGDLAQWNHLTPPYYVSIGQKLRLTPPKEESTAVAPTPLVTPSAAPEPPPEGAPRFTPVKEPASSQEVPDVKPAPLTPKQASWPWPVKGKIITSFSETNKGIDIAVPVGTKITAVQAGTVAYSGSNLHGYGQLLIIRQDKDMMTAYAHNSKLLVAEGSKVKTGQVIALSGNTEASEPMLHFEVRRGGKPVDPLLFLNSP